MLSFKVTRDVEDLEFLTPATLLMSSYPHIIPSSIHIAASQLFLSGQSIEKRKAEAKAKPKAKSAAKAKSKGKKKGNVKTEPEVGGHFENMKDEDCEDEPMDDENEDLDGSQCEAESNDEEQGDDGTIFGDADM